MDATGLADPVVGRVLEGRYQVTGVIARGGMATVYTATDLRLDREVAVKVMHPALAEDPDFAARFEREARAAARIASPAVVSVIDAGVDGSTAFLVMELVRGRTLRALLRERGRLTPAQALAVCEPVAQALAAAHRAGVVHRDVKPENVLLSADGEVKVADFGLARALAASPLTATTGLLLGTVAYLAPEQVTQGQVGTHADVYAAGVMLYELLTGVPPFEAETPLAVAYRHVHDTVPPPSAHAPGVPAALDDLVAAATAREAADRIADGTALLAAVRRARLAVPEVHDTRVIELHEAPTTALRVPPSPPSPPSPPAPPAGRRRGPGVRRRRWPLVLVVLLLASAAAGIAGWWFGSGRYVHIPRLSGLTPAAAEHEIHAEGLLWRLDPHRVYSDTVAAGLVAAQRPAPGTRTTRGGTVVLEVSRGPLMESVPSLAGLSLDAARAALSAHQLRLGPVREAYSTSVPAGEVISTDPRALTVVRHATPVALTVSQGPAPVRLPDLRGEPLAQAQATLAALDLQVSLTRAYSAQVPQGEVLAQSPLPGATAHQGDQVALVESLGPPFVTMPDVTGDTPGQAEATLTGLGLRYRVEQFPGSPGVDVVHQSPAAGTRVRLGTLVTLYVF